MSEDYNKAANRIFYVAMRKQVKCPPMLAVKHNWGWVVESKDGSIYLESVKAVDVWDAKAAGVQEWINKYVDVKDTP